MRCQFLVLLPLCIMTIAARAQDGPAALLNIGDPAPSLRLRGWVKGEPVERFEKGKVYVLEFWATYCRPCIAAMPHLSELANEYRDKVTVLGIDVYEKKTVSLEKIRAFVDSMGSRMDFGVAAEDSNFMVTGWLEGTGEKLHGIPRTFVIDGGGRLAWMGYPTALGEVLPRIVNNTWDKNDALAKRNESRRLEALDDSLGFEFAAYRSDYYKASDRRKADSILLWVDEIVKKEPKLRYAPLVAVNTFSALLQTDPRKAYEFGKVELVTPTYEGPNYHLIYGPIEIYMDKVVLPADVYRLGAEACQMAIDHRVYQDNDAFARLYRKMAVFYWRANDRAKAMEAAQKAIEMKRRGNRSRQVHLKSSFSNMRSN